MIGAESRAAVLSLASAVLLALRARWKQQHGKTACSSDAVIDLANGQPSDALLLRAHDAIAAACRHALQPPSSGYSILNYGDVTKDASDITVPYRTALAGLLTRQYGYTVHLDALFPTSGVSHGLDMLCTLFARSGSVVLCEDPCYFCALQLFAEDHGLEVWPVASDEDGMRPDELERSLDRAAAAGRHVALCYFIPAFQNPMGSTMPAARRAQLAAISEAHGLLLVADEVYQMLALPEAAADDASGGGGGGDSGSEAGGGLPPPMGVFGGELVVSVSSFSKVLAPGLRVGWIEARPAVMRRLLDSGLTYSGGVGSQFAASVVASAIELGFVEAHLRALKQAYAAQLRAVTAALRAHLPAGCAFRAPRGGYFVWVRLPAGSVASEVLAQPGIGLKAMAGPRCSPGGRAHHECLRLCFARCGPAELEEGCRRLGAAIHRGTS